MPVLPSGRRVEFSLDRFLAMLDGLDPDEVRTLTETMEHPDDLLPVVDIVYFDAEHGTPYFAGHVAADWERHAASWSAEDRMAMRFHLKSDISQEARGEAIATLKSLTGASTRRPTASAMPPAALQAA